MKFGQVELADLQLQPEFPNSSFNHVILTVPTSAGGTLFLECTSQINPFGYTGSFTGNRKALALEQDKSRVIDLSAPSSAESLRFDSVQMSLDAGQSTAKLNWNAIFQGMAIEDKPFYQEWGVGGVGALRWKFLSDNFDKRYEATGIFKCI